MRQILLTCLAVVLSFAHSSAQYCTGVGPTSTADSNVESVALNGDAATAINYTGCSGTIGILGLEDLTATQSVDVTAGTGYTADIQFGTCNGNYAGAGEAWIDWNQNDVFDPSESIGTWTGTPPTAITNMAFTVPVTAFNGATRMRVVQEEGGANPLDPCASFVYGSAVDFTINVSGGVTLTCPAPSTLTAANLTATSADLGWTENGTATSWEIEWGAAGFTQGTGTAVVTATNPHPVAGLTAATSYDFYVRAICGVGDTSIWAGPYNFTTNFNAPTGVTCVSGGSASFVFSDDMETAIGWTGDVGTANAQWDFPTAAPGGNSTNTGPSAAHSGTTYAEFEASGIVATVASMVTPMIDLTVGSDQAELSFYMHAFGADIGTLNVGVGTSPTGPFTTVFSWSGQYQATAADPWAHIGVDLSTYLGQQIYIEFSYGALTSGFEGDMAIDLVQVETCVNCAIPSALTSANILATSADLGWTENGTATNWEVEWGAPGFTPGSGTNVFTSSNPHNATGLTANTTYDFYVRAICGVGDTSAWAGPASFLTPCATYTAPYLDDVETHTPTLAFTLSECWTATAASAFDWNIDGAGSTPSTGTGPLGAFSGVNYFYVEASSGVVGDLAELISPSVDINPLTAPALEFRYHMFGDNNGVMSDLYIDIYDGATWTVVDSIKGEQQAAQADPWLKRTIDLSAFSGTIQVKFRAYKNGAQWGDASLDDIEIKEAPTCFDPTNLTIANLMATSADLGWTENGTATSWEVEWGAAGFTQGTGTSVVTATNPHSVTGLTDATAYEFYVRAVCAPGDSSAWVGPFAFTTPCLPLTAPWSEPFGATIPACWNQGAANGESWIFATTGGHVGNAGTLGGATASGGEFAYVDDSGVHSTGTTLESPLVDVSGLTTPALRFFLIKNNEGFTNVDFSVDVYDGTAWNTGVYTNNGNTVNGEWEEIVVDLSALTITGPVQLRFIVDENNGTDFYDDAAIDDVSLIELPSCTAPSSLTATNILGTSADLGWTENGTATSWEVEWGAAGFAQGAGTAVVTATNPHSVTGLTAATAYEFYVRAVCAPGDTSTWAGPFAFVTPCAVYTPAYYTDFTTFMPTCWEEAGDGNPTTGPSDIGNGLWNQTDYLNGGGANNAAKINLYTTNRTDWLLGPTFDLSSGSWELAINAGVTTFNGTGSIAMGSDDTVQVLISTDGGITWAPIYTWDAANAPTNTGSQYLINLGAYTNANTMFAIWATDNVVNDAEDYDFHIGDFEIRPFGPPALADLVITEIMYNFPGGGTDTVEYIEIYNNGATPVDLTGYSFGQGVTHTFAGGIIAPSDYFVVAFNDAAFTNTFGFPADDIWTSGGLSNAGEDISILDNLGRLVDSVDYDQASFPVITNTSGYSIVLCDTASNNNDGTNWSQSYTNTGFVVATIPATPLFASPGAGNNCMQPLDVQPTTFVGLDTTYCNVPAITASVVITNNSTSTATNVPYTILANGFPILVDSIPSMAFGQMDTITVGPIPATTGVATVQVFTSLMGDADLSNDTISQMVWISNTTATAFETVAISCNGDSTGEVRAIGSDGLASLYNYMWDANAGNATTPIVPGLPAGTYMVTVTDSIGCADTSMVTLVEPTAVVLAIDSSSNAPCNGDMGMANATATGGTGTINYLWMGAGQGTQMAMLPAGTHYVTATDANGCSAVDSVVITEPTALVAAAVDNANATATASGTGGTAPYMFMWDAATGNQTTATVTGLINGTYAVTVTDANGCTDSTTVTITGVGFENIANLSNLNMFPNPTSGNVFVELELNEADDVQITILNAVGQLVVRRELVNTQSEKVELKTAAFPAGVYMVQFTIGNEQITRKLIISK